jgi:ribosomal protein S18 acetylase RimI-like enzyme
MAEPAARAPKVETFDEGDLDSLRAFLQRVPRGEYLFLKEDMEDLAVIDVWRTRPGGQVLVAYLDGELAGLLAVVPGLGWSRHTGELRLVVDPDRRGRGVGAALARKGVSAAVDAGLSKLWVEVLADQTGVASLFESLGFTPEALLVDHVRSDDDQQFHDLLVFSHRVLETWSALSTVGLIETGHAE